MVLPDKIIIADDHPLFRQALLTTLTEKLLLFGGAIQEAGAVKSNKIKKGATSDFMEIERQRGISVATSVLAFEYTNIKIND